jgi:hypothetical protein
MTTAATILNRVARQLLSGTVEERNKLAATINDSATSIVLSYDLGGFRTGSVFELESELIYVWEADTATKTHYRGTWLQWKHGNGSHIRCFGDTQPTVPSCPNARFAQRRHR